MISSAREWSVDVDSWLHNHDALVLDFRVLVTGAFDTLAISAECFVKADIALERLCLLPS